MTQETICSGMPHFPTVWQTASAAIPVMTVWFSRSMSRGARVPEFAQEAVSQLLKEFEMIKAGKNPEGIGAFDD